MVNARPVWAAALVGLVVGLVAEAAVLVAYGPPLVKLDIDCNGKKKQTYSVPLQAPDWGHGAAAPLRSR